MLYAPGGPLKHFSHYDYFDIARAKTFEELLEIALNVVHRMDGEVAMLCGPITTGGAGTMEENMKRFTVATLWMWRNGRRVFSQIPFEDRVQEIKAFPYYYRGGTHL